VKVSSISSAAKPDQNILTAAKGGGIAFAGTLFAYVVRFVIGIVLARFLGAEQYGLYDLALVAATLASGLARLGLGQAIVRYVSLFASRRDTAGLWGTLQVGLGLTTSVSLLTGIGLYGLATPIAERLFHEPRLVPLLRLASFIVPFLVLTDLLAAATRGFNKMQYSAIGEVSQSLIKLVLLVVLAIAVGLNAPRALAAHIFAVTLVCAMLLYFLNRLFPLRRTLQTARRNIGEMLKFGLPLYVTYLITTFRGNIQTVLLGALSTVTTVGVFTVANQINLVGKMFHQSIAMASNPIVSELYARGDWEQMKRLYQTTSRWTFTLNLPLFLVVLLFPTPILSIFGQSFVGGTTALTILAWINLVSAGTGFGGVIIDMSGNTFLKVVNVIIVSITTLSLSFLLIPHWGIVGAATAALATALIGHLLALLEVFILFRLLPYNVSFLKPVAAGLAALTTALAMDQLLPSEASLVYTAVNVALLLAVYVGMILLLGFSKEDYIVLTRLRGRVGRMLSSLDQT
jgi:O-antigen/teichoic acid export membrane protein